MTGPLTSKGVEDDALDEKGTGAAGSTATDPSEEPTTKTTTTTLAPTEPGNDAASPEEAVYAPADVVAVLTASSLPAAAPSVPPLTLVARALGIFALIGWSVGVVLGTILMKGNLDPFLTSNLLGTTGRMFLLLSMAGGAALSVAVSSVVHLRRRKRPGAAARFYQAGKRLSPIALGGFLPFLFRWRTWNGRDLTFLYMVALFSLSAYTALKASLSSPPLASGPRGKAFWRALARPFTPFRDALALRRWRRLPLALVVLGGAAYATLFSIYTLTFHRNLRTAAYDLGLEDNLVWNVLHGIGFFRSTPFSGPTGSHFGNHATFFSYVIAPFYALAQGAGTLLVIQSLMIGMAAIPLFLFARRHVGDWAACLIALLYLLYPPNHGANLYEFHYIPFGAFFLWMSLFLFEARRDLLGTVFVILAMSVREDIGGAGVAVLGAYLLISGERPRVGLILAIAGGLQFCLLKLVFMPLVLGGESFITFYKDLEPAGQQNFGGVIKTVFGNPFYTLHTLIERDKLLYMLQYLVPLAFLPLRRPIVLLLMIPGFFFTVLSTGYAPLIQTTFQYTFYWTVFLFIGLVGVLDRKNSSPQVSDGEYVVRKRAALFAMACAMIPVSYQSGAIFQRNTAKGGFSPYNFETSARDLADRRTFAEIVKLIPRRASVSASDNLVPQISNRPVAYTLRFSVFDAEYILFFSDPSRIEFQERGKVSEALTSGEFGVVDVRPPFAVAKRGYSTALNDRVLVPWGMRMPSLPPPHP
ncbi:MAG TPA: DUF2079 domain-containing protein [Polyangia bacterium]|nr:DUF2079 domain-containing protein [Polyangia bacterium]